MFSTIKIGGSILDLSCPKVMTVINVTPDSFYVPSRHTALTIIESVSSAMESGTSILDVGGCSTRPGAVFPTADEEYTRVREAVLLIRSNFPRLPLSLDTFRSEVVRKIVEEFGPVLVNDISGGADPNMFKTVSSMQLPYVLCHMKGTLDTMHQVYAYDDIVSEMLHYFAEKLSVLFSLGIYDVIIDPGFGFSKTPEQNMKVVEEYNKFLSLGFPLMAGISRKRFVNSSLSETSEIHLTLLHRGAKLLRVHDTETAVSLISRLRT